MISFLLSQWMNLRRHHKFLAYLWRLESISIHGLNLGWVYMTIQNRWRNSNIEQSYQLRVKKELKEFPPWPKSQAWENEVALCGTTFVIYIISLHSRKYFTEFENPNFNLRLSLECFVPQVSWTEPLCEHVTLILFVKTLETNLVKCLWIFGRKF